MGLVTELKSSVTALPDMGNVHALGPVQITEVEVGRQSQHGAGSQQGVKHLECSIYCSIIS